MDYTSIIINFFGNTFPFVVVLLIIFYSIKTFLYGRKYKKEGYITMPVSSLSWGLFNKSFEPVFLIGENDIIANPFGFNKHFPYANIQEVDTSSFLGHTMTIKFHRGSRLVAVFPIFDAEAKLKIALQEFQKRKIPLSPDALEFLAKK